MPKGESYVKIEATFIAKTDMAVFVAWDEDQSWIPRSCLSYSCDQRVGNLKRHEQFQLEVAEWMANQHGMRY